MNKLMLVAVLVGWASIQGCSCGTVEPGNRGVVTTFGKVNSDVLKEGFQTYPFFGGHLHEVSIRQQKAELDAPCFSSDLQHVDLKVAVLFHIPEDQVVPVFRDFNGEPFDTLVAPRVQEAIKEATATRTAELIVKEREAIKVAALEATRKKVGKTIVIDDLIVANVGLSAQLNQAIEAKMVQAQQTQQAEYAKQKAEVEAQTAVAVAKGEAEAQLTRAEAEAKAIKIKGDALHQNPGVVELNLIDKWNGQTPEIVGGNGNGGMSLLLPALNKK